MSRRTTREKVHGALLFLITVGVVAHQLSLWRWTVEDAAISFAYARNLIHGEGLVAYPGGERVEGYSNPTWVLILALVQLFGFDPFLSTKIIELAMGILTVPLVHASVREASGRDSDLPLVAAAFLAANSQFAIFGAAGLENGLLNLLIALACWRMTVELRTGGLPWSSLAWLLVSLTRPEGLLYAAIGGFWSMVFQLHARRGLRSTLVWLILFFVPFGLYQAWHLWYFAWPLANTFYAKVDEDKQIAWLWNRRAWNWTRDFFHQMGQGYFLPVWIAGILGEGRRRYAFATGAFLIVGATIELSHDQRWLLPVMVGALWATFWLGLQGSGERPPKWLMVAATSLGLVLIGSSELLRSFGLTPNPLPSPHWLRAAPPHVLAAFGLLLPIAGFGSRGWQLRALSWSLCCSVVFFAIYVQWDWMKGFRWYATAAVPGAILFAFGTDALVRLVESMFDWRAPDPIGGSGGWSAKGSALAMALVLLQLPANIAETWRVSRAPDASPKGVKVRLDYVDRLRDRLQVDERFVDLDVDQGAHLWWSDFEMMDIAGLVDLPLAHHKFDRSFVREYVFQERRPHYAHVHDVWARNSGIPTHPEWKRDYVEVPGYPSGKEKVHGGNFVRRDLILAPAWPGPEQRLTIGDRIGLYPPQVPSEPASGRKFHVELGLASLPGPVQRRDFRAILFASDGERLHSWDLPPGYDWIRPGSWGEDEVFVGRFDLRLPESLPPGTYDLGLVFIGSDGRVIPYDGADPLLPPRMAAGEILFPGALTVLSVEDRSAAATADRQQALALASDLDCEGAELAWKRARQHRAGQQDWVKQHLPAIRPALSSCWARSADGKDRDEQIRRLVRARTWDWWNEAYRTRASALGEALHQEGLLAREARDWEGAYRLFSDAVDVDRSRSWSRRYAEEARTHRLGIQRGFTPDAPAKAAPAEGPEVPEG